MSQPTTNPIAAQKHYSVILSHDERGILFGFIEAGMKAEVARCGLSTDSSLTVQNAVYLAKKLSEAHEVQQIPIAAPAPVACPQSEDVTDVVKP